MLSMLPLFCPPLAGSQKDTILTSREENYTKKEGRVHLCFGDEKKKEKKKRMKIFGVSAIRPCSSASALVVTVHCPPLAVMVVG